MEEAFEIDAKLIIKNSDNSDLSQIQNLRLFDKGVTKMTNLDLIPNVRVINLCHNHIKEVEGLQKNIELREINLQYNHLEMVSSFAFENCKQLIHLNLSFNKIHSFAASASFQRLQVLNLENNNLQSLEFVQYLRDLRILNLSHNQIKNIDPLTYAVKLEELYLSQNYISHLSERTLSNNPNLQILDLSYNQITTLKFVPNLASLGSLNVSHNKIAKIDVKKKVQFLESLEIGNNLISSIKEIGEFFPFLVKLDISFNENLDTLSTLVLEKMFSLREINFAGNYFSNKQLEEEVLKECPYLEIINDKQVNEIGFKERQEMEEIRNQGGAVSVTGSEWTDISTTSDDVDFDGLKKNIELRAAEARRNDNLFHDQQEYKSFMEGYEDEMLRLHFIHKVTTEGKAFLTQDPDPEAMKENVDVSNNESQSKDESVSKMGIGSEPQSPERSREMQSYSQLEANNNSKLTADTSRTENGSGGLRAHTMHSMTQLKTTEKKSTTARPRSTKDLQSLNQPGRSQQKNLLIRTIKGNTPTNKKLPGYSDIHKGRYSNTGFSYRASDRENINEKGTPNEKQSHTGRSSSQTKRVGSQQSKKFVPPSDYLTDPAEIIQKTKEGFNEVKERYKGMNVKDLVGSKNRTKISDAIKMSRTFGGEGGNFQEDSKSENN